MNVNADECLHQCCLSQESAEECLRHWCYPAAQQHVAEMRVVQLLDQKNACKTSTPVQRKTSAKYSKQSMHLLISCMTELEAQLCLR